MKTSTAGRQLIERYEGLFLQAYDDANDHIVKPGSQVHGTITIGYGHTTAAGAPSVYAGQSITKLQADDILASDLRAVEAEVNRLVKVPLNQNQYDALVSFHFNTGSLGRSSLLKSLNQGDYKGAANGFMLYTKGRVGGQLVPMAGLTRRRTEEKALFLKTSTATPTHTVAAGAVVAGSVAATNYPHLLWYIIPAIIVVVAGIYIIYLIKRKQNVGLPQG